MKESLIYPGVYTPLHSLEPLLSDLILSKKDNNVQHLANTNMDEYTEYYKLKIAIPGVSRDQIMIYIHKNILSIAAMNKECECALSEDEKLKIHEFDCVPLFQSHIFLPNNADAKFIFAKLNEGILDIRIPKTTKTEKNRDHHIVIY